jgi:hypothetical protein
MWPLLATAHQLVVASGLPATGNDRYNTQPIPGVAVGELGGLRINGLGEIRSTFNSWQLGGSSQAAGTMTIDRSREHEGVTTVHLAPTGTFTLTRTLSMQAGRLKSPSASYSRVLVEDRFTTVQRSRGSCVGAVALAQCGGARRASVGNCLICMSQVVDCSALADGFCNGTDERDDGGVGEATGIYTNHTFVFSEANSSRVSRVYLWGALGATPWGACTTNQERGTQGNPSSWAMVASEGGTGPMVGSVGFMAFDDVMRTHAVLSQNATAPCTSGPAGSVHSMALLDPHLALPSGGSYTATWALYFNHTAVGYARRAHGTAAKRYSADDYDYINQLRQDLGVTNITIAGTQTCIHTRGWSIRL